MAIFDDAFMGQLWLMCNYEPTTSNLVSTNDPWIVQECTTEALLYPITSNSIIIKMVTVAMLDLTDWCRQAIITFLLTFYCQESGDKKALYQA